MDKTKKLYSTKVTPPTHLTVNGPCEMIVVGTNKHNQIEISFSIDDKIRVTKSQLERTEYGYRKKDANGNC